ncbi:hypothetical protein DPMN_138321 [Dreissena polymorpha]|uniref:Uncharacterized protein n=1 Tax=Dreissena polymorpha TaxID=45954 RepID=A0A9D4G6F3_DREPO|nr:hypothetical protein DPMN_138321 [Dreissena polymorpha]
MSNQCWAGLSSDLAIEQTLMRSLKNTACLIRGSGVAEEMQTFGPYLHLLRPSPTVRCMISQTCSILQVHNAKTQLICASKEMRLISIKYTHYNRLILL